MKVAAAFVVLAVLGFLAARASADTVPVPVPAPPTVTVPALPTVPLPLPTVPKLPAPVVPAPAPAPTEVTVTAPTVVVPATGAGSGGTVQMAAPSVQTPSVSGRSGGAGSQSSSSTSSSSTPSRGSSQSLPPAQVERLRTSSRWIGAKGRRFTTITFVLPRAAHVIFTVTQVFPACKGVGHFTVAGHAGVNKWRFAGRFRGKPLAPGTYRIAVRTVGGHSVRRVTIVIVDGSAPSTTELAAARAANACASALALSSPRRSDLATQVTRSFTPEQHASAIGAPKGSNSHSGVLASTAERAVRAIRPLLVALLAASILLLGLASLPNPAVPGPRLNYLLVQHRLELAGLGAVALVGVAIAFILG
jgi:hypothetical protein